MTKWVIVGKCKSRLMLSMVETGWETRQLSWLGLRGEVWIRRIYIFFDQCQSRQGQWGWDRRRSVTFEVGDKCFERRGWGEAKTFRVKEGGEVMRASSRDCFVL